MPLQSRLRVRQVNGVTVVRFPQSDVSGETIANLVDDRIVLDFADVERLDSAVVAKIVWQHKKLKAAGGRMTLCNLNPTLLGIFQTLQLHRFLHIYGDEQEALQ